MARYGMGELGTRGRPEAEGAVDVQPCTGPCDGIGDLRDRVERARVDLAQLGAHDRRPVAAGQRVSESGHIHPSLVVGRNLDDRCRSEAEQPKRAVDRDVAPGTAENPDRGRSGQSVALEVPAGVRQHRVPRGGEAGRLGHLAAGGEREGRVVRDAEELLQPAAHDLLDDRGGRAACVQAGVLVPGRGEPVGGESRRHGAADDEAEVAAARNRDDAGSGRFGELLDDCHRIGRSVRQRAAECLTQLVHGDGRPDGPLFERVEEVARELCGSVEELALAHAARSFSKRAGSSYGPTSARYSRFPSKSSRATRWTSSAVTASS